MPQIKKYQIYRSENNSSRLLGYAGSPLELIQKITNQHRKDYSAEYEITYTPESWKTLGELERNVLEGIRDLHSQAVKKT